MRLLLGHVHYHEAQFAFVSVLLRLRPLILLAATPPVAHLEKTIALLVVFIYTTVACGLLPHAT